MPYSRYIDDNGILITTISGVVTLKELIKLQNELHEYGHNEAIYELAIHTDDIDMIPDSKETIVSADNFRKALKGFKRGAIAFVTKKDFLFGLLRQQQMRVANEYIQLCVFRTEETARKWLQEMKSLREDELSDRAKYPTCS